MGNSVSDAAVEAPAAGYRVLAVHPGSPAACVTVFPDPIAARAGVREPVHTSLVAYFDVITSINGLLLEAESDTFAREVKENVGRSVILEVYNSKSNRYTTVQVRPSDSWGGKGLLGVHVRWDTLDADVDDTSLHVVGVAPGSPAEACGMVPGDDWVLCAEDAPFNGTEEFGEYLATHAGVEITLYVYRASTDAVWHTSLVLPEGPWGEPSQTGIGVTLATGRMHALPNRKTSAHNAFEDLAANAAAASAGPQHSNPPADQHASSMSLAQVPPQSVVVSGAAPHSFAHSTATQSAGMPADPHVHAMQQFSAPHVQQPYSLHAAAPAPAAPAWSATPSSTSFPPSAGQSSTAAFFSQPAGGHVAFGDHHAVSGGGPAIAGVPGFAPQGQGYGHPPLQGVYGAGPFQQIPVFVGASKDDAPARYLEEPPE